MISGWILEPPDAGFWSPQMPDDVQISDGYTLKARRELDK